LLSTPPESARELPFRDGNAGFSLILKRNCSISPAALAGVLVALAAVVLAVGVGFAFAGAWLVLPFAGLEALALAGAYLAYARHAADYERIDLAAGRLTVEVAEAHSTLRYEMEARRARVCLENDGVVLRGAGKELQLGRHLDAQRRAQFAAQLQERLRI
jgi:uncharacterized membrane protein